MTERTEKIRVSADQKDPGFRADFTRFEAYCNGKKLDYCVTADEERGHAVCRARDENGYMRMPDGSIAFTHHFGTITIRRIPDDDLSSGALAKDDAGESG